MTTTETKIIPCNYSDPEHLQAVAGLINAYIHDEMGGGEPLSELRQLRLVDGLRNHPTAIVLLAENDGAYCGLLTAFENFATFAARPMINIHDLMVLPAARGKGIGRQLMNALIDEARRRDCCRVTLEVRHDNPVAQTLYMDLGFDDTDPPMFYWRKYL
ncbi:MAG: GNAT family N-acetyltransferase [Tannerella sp.]|jgi:ribosomal protein S18 acetylase RimI-like enzyme|nr:GNAT family N-acetyltransferase [Tannerella sp.]